MEYYSFLTIKINLKYMEAMTESMWEDKNAQGMTTSIKSSLWLNFCLCTGHFVRIYGKMDRFVYKDILRIHVLPYGEKQMPLCWVF